MSPKRVGRAHGAEYSKRPYTYADFSATEIFNIINDGIFERETINKAIPKV